MGIIKDVLNNPACQTRSAAGQTSSSRRQQGFIFTLKDLEITISRVNGGLEWDRVHSSLLKLAGPVFRKLL